MAASSRPRVFLDTNVLVSALYSAAGPPGQILKLHAADRITIVVSQLVLDELLSSIRRKFRQVLPDLRSFLLSAPPEIVPDPSPAEVDRLSATVNFDDAPILAAALAAEVDAFVTGDAALLRQAKRLHTSIRLPKPAQFLKDLPPTA